MKLIIFSVFDSKADAFITPFFSPTVAVGVRSFATAANDPNCQFAVHPGDYSLFELGEFDQEKGSVTTLKAMKNHGLALTFQNSEENPNV